MHKHRISTLSTLSTLISLCFAQTSTVTLYIPGADPQPLEASVITASASVTTYLLQCIPGTGSDECGFDGAVTLTEGLSTAAYTFGGELDANGTLLFTGYQACSLAGTTSAVCVESAGGSEANDPGISTVTYNGTDLPYMPVVVTAQAEAGTGATMISATSASATTTFTGTSLTGSGRLSVTSTGESSSGSFVVQTTLPTIAPTTTSSQSALSGTSTSTGGGAVATGSSGWIIGGMAAALALLA